MDSRRRKFYGWGYADEGAAPDEIRLLERTLAAREGSLTWRFTHLYPDGPAPYFTLTCPLDKAKMLEQQRPERAVPQRAPAPPD